MWVGRNNFIEKLFIIMVKMDFLRNTANANILNMIKYIFTILIQNI